MSHDWIPERSAHKFPLRQYYVQLEWNQKIRTAMGSNTVTMMSLHDLIKDMGTGTCKKTQETAANNVSKDVQSIIVEGKGYFI